jgi:diaminopimelate epimerase
MTSIPFCKFHGFGNDYIVIERTALPEGTDLSALAVSMCQRNTGVGGDGIAVIEKLDADDKADHFCEIVNPDGSIAGFSGNGTRCAVSYLYYKHLWREPSLRLKTRSGIKNYTLIERMSDGHYWFEAEIGKAEVWRTRRAGERMPRAVPLSTTRSMSRAPSLLFSGVNVGNPVACVFVDSFDLDWRRYGRAMETHATFPERANIVFVKIVDNENIELRIWERGAGETSASGTCSSGAAVLSAFTGGPDAPCLCCRRAGRPRSIGERR